MSNPINDKLQKVLNGLNVDSRLSIWLWLFLKGQAPQADLGELGSPGMRDRLADLIQATERGVKYIEESSSLYLLPAKDLEWITHSKRQNLFITGKILEKNNYLPILGQVQLTDRELTIATIDAWLINAAQKSWLINQIKSEWDFHSSSDHIFKWLDGTETKQRLETAWEVTKSKYPLLTLLKSPPQEKDDLIITLDSPNITVHEKMLLMNSIKKRWSQNKYRAKSIGKKQRNFILSDKAIYRLEEIAKKHDLKKTEVLEILLKMEEEKGIYISERINVLKGI